MMVRCLKATLRLVDDFSSMAGYNAATTLRALQDMGSAALPTSEFRPDFLVGIAHRITLSGVAEDKLRDTIMDWRWRDARPQGVRLPRKIRLAFEAYLLAGEIQAGYDFVANATA